MKKKKKGAKCHSQALMNLEKVEINFRFSATLEKVGMISTGVLL